MRRVALAPLLTLIALAAAVACVAGAIHAGGVYSRRALLSPVPAQAKTASPLGTSLRSSFATWFDGCGARACACGVPPHLLVDAAGATIPHVALNVQNTPTSAPHLARPISDALQQQGKVGMYMNGANCGRWVEITLQGDCIGRTTTASSPPSVCDVNPLTVDPLQSPYYANDTLTGRTVYAVVADSCHDGSFWCA
jgi:hypothetical protein